LLVILVKRLMALTLRRMSAVLAIVLAALAAGTLLFGNQRQAHANVPPPDFGSQIVCRIFTDLNSIGSPLPHLAVDDNCRETPPAPLPQCSDTIDNDNDGLIDYPADPGCTSSDDDTEAPNPIPISENTLTLCSDGVDNDSDQKIDLADPDCAGFQAKLVVVKVVVNDDNGTSTVSDFSLHVASASTGASETIGVSSGATTTVSVGTWTVGEIQKPGYSASFSGDCSSAGVLVVGIGETKTCTITNNDIALDVTALPALSACADGVDNDGDGLVDGADPGCSGTGDNDETDAPQSGSGSLTAGGSGSIGGGGGNGPIVTSAISGNIATASLGVVLGASTTTRQEFCDRYLTAYIKLGSKNDPVQVKRLQAVLRDFEGANIKEDGFYDGPTLAAVHSFQTKYASDILIPWGLRKSTGFVYLTTRKKVNEIYCKNTEVFSLTEEQLKEISAARDLAKSTPAVPLATSPKPSASESSAPNKKSQAEGGKAGEKETPASATRGALRSLLNYLNGFF
jgi:hypothetical protein